MRTRSPVRVASISHSVPQWQKWAPRVADSGSSRISTLGSPSPSKMTTRGRPRCVPVTVSPGDRGGGSRSSYELTRVPQLKSKQELCPSPLTGLHGNGYDQNSCLREPVSRIRYSECGSVDLEGGRAVFRWGQKVRPSCADTPHPTYPEPRTEYDETVSCCLTANSSLPSHLDPKRYSMLARTDLRLPTPPSRVRFQCSPRPATIPSW